jgi:hypothetical protein
MPEEKRQPPAQPPVQPRLDTTEVTIACRASKSCSGNQATMTRAKGSSYVRYKCLTCNKSWGFNVGGAVSL